jgi:hypothetical protein
MKGISSFHAGSRRLMVGLLAIALVIIGYGFLATSIPSDNLLVQPLHRSHSSVPTEHSRPVDVQLTPEAITQLLARLDHAKRQKDPDAILRHISHDATITIHMLYGAQQHMLTLSLADYRTSLNKSFAIPTANDYTRLNTTILVAKDAQTAKASFKSTETLSRDRPKLQIEGEESLLFSIRNGRLMIIAIDEFVPGDFT